MIIVIDGPEKVGKSTAISVLAEYIKNKYAVIPVIRHWGPTDPDDRVYTEALKEDTATDFTERVAIWDRSWASEYVYASLLNRDKRLRDDPWLGEWLHGRAAVNKFILLEDVRTLKHRRDETDLPVDPAFELKSFRAYAETYGWNAIAINGANPGTVARHIMRSCQWTLNYAKPPAYCGPLNPHVVFVGEKIPKNAHVQMPGAWLPFSSRLTMNYGRELGELAFKCGWTNTRDVPPPQLRHASIIVSCGETARLWVDNYVIHHSDLPGASHFSLPHPAWLYRYNNKYTSERMMSARSTLALIKVFIHQYEMEA